MRVSDRVIGVALGILLGLAIVIVFVFFGSGETIDAPSLSGEGTEPPLTTTQPSTGPTQP
jgi:hypothetical protein